MGAMRDSTRRSTANFFNDCPWLDIPAARRGEVLIEPLYPRGGLLGGSAPQGSGKPSKLAALAAARRQKENDRKAGDSSSSSLVILDKLYRKDSSTTADPSPGKSEPEISETTSPKPSSSAARSSALKYPTRKRESVDQSQPKEEASDPRPRRPSDAELEKRPEPIIAPAAHPSAFAQTMFGLPTERSANEARLPADSSPLDALNSLQYALPKTSKTASEPNAFTGPSPDDIVLKAQSSKGPAKGQKKG